MALSNPCIARTAIHKDPANRFQTAREFLGAVAPFAHGPSDDQAVLALLVSRFRPTHQEPAFADAIRRGRHFLPTRLRSSGLPSRSPGRRRLALALLVVTSMLAAGVADPRRRRSKRVALARHDGSPIVSAGAMLDQAVEAIFRGDTTSALTLARASAKARPSPDAFIMVGRLQFSRDPVEAKMALEAALALSPAHPEAIKLLTALDGSARAGTQ